MSRRSRAQAAFDLAMRHRQAGRAAEARRLCLELVRGDPKHLKALSLLGKLELEAGNPGDAVPWFERAAALAPDSPIYFCNLGIAHHKLGALEPAAKALSRAAALSPPRAEAFQNLGLVLLDRGDVETGLRSLIRATELDPGSFALKRLLARELARAGYFDGAIARYLELVVQDASSAELNLELVTTYMSAGRPAEAEALARKLTETHPTFAAAHAALGRVLAKRFKFSDAAEVFRRVYLLSDEAVTATVCEAFANALARLGRVDEAIDLLERRLAQDPTLHSEHSSLIFCAMFSARYSALALLDVARGWNGRHAERLSSRRKPHLHDRSPERRLRLGYVSPNFRNHVMGLLMLPVFRCHDHSRFEVVCYSSAQSTDFYTDEIKKCADEWHDVQAVSDTDLARRIRDDRIDILVDLSMHMGGNRLRTFAEKPAPVQMTWAYPGTTGLDAIDYRVSDRNIDPDGAPLPYSEQTLRLPHSFWCYGPFEKEREVKELPMLENGYPTFGCLNTFLKVNRYTLELWARVLVASPDSRLLVLAPLGSARDFAREVLEKQGVDAERIGFVDVQGRPDYLDTYGCIDVALDTFPYNGHTTSLDAYFMGVPVVTLVGETVVGRAGFCLATNLNLGDWVARDPDEFVSIATRVSSDPARLRELRKSLRQRMKDSPLMDAARFARDLEGLYREAWQRFCARPG
jgi:predicted O-linked N-acetylglucosamine transferase (SPINDLY family)